MAQAHKLTKLAFKNTAVAVGSAKLTYREVFRIYLKQAHKEYKAMNNPARALALQTIAKFEKQLDELSAMLKVEGVEDQYIVTVENMPVDFNATTRMPFSGIAGATKFTSEEYAEQQAKRVRNGNRVGGVAVRLSHHIQYEMQELCRLINEIRASIA